MLPPRYLREITNQAVAVSNLLHQDIINAIVSRILLRIGRGDKYILTPKDKYQLEVLTDAGYLREDLEKEIAKRVNKQNKVIKQAFEDAGVTSFNYDSQTYKLASISTKSLAQSPTLIRLLQTGYERTAKSWINLTRTFANAAQTLFISQCDVAYNLVSTGTISYTEAVRNAVETISQQGVTVRYPSGHIDTIETATLRCVRTGIAQSTAQVTLERAKENGVDLVLTTAHMGARPSHEVWQGRIFHIDWETFDPYALYDDNSPAPLTTAESKYPDFVTATRYGYVDGLCGANCRHSFTPYFEGLSHNPWEQMKPDTEENNRNYEITQRQRELERRIRKSKREFLALESAFKGAQDAEVKETLNKAMQRKANVLHRQNLEYDAFCRANDLKRFDDRLSIAGWDRSASGRAVSLYT